MKLTNKSLIKLLIAAIITTALAAFLHLKPQTKTAAFTSGSLLIQGLEPSAINTISLSNASDTATITRSAQGFSVAQKQDYPTDINDINRLLIALLDIRLASEAAGEITDQNKSDFGLDKPATIELFGDNDKPLLKLQIGTNTERGTFITLGKAVYITKLPFEFSAKPIDYINQSLLALNTADIESIAATSGDSKFSFKSKDNALFLSDLPKEKEEDSSKTWGFKSALTRLSFDDLKKSEDFKPTSEIVISMKSGMKYTLKFDANRNASVSATPPPQQLVQKSMQIRADSDKKELAQKDAVLQALNIAKDFNQTHASWLYQLPKFEYEKINVKLSALTKDKPADNEPQAQKPATAPQPTPQPAK